jgi:peptidoglycan/LPS O-acetylase OafA/YrhL
LTQPHTSTDFRTDINGLRAYAVLGVLLYHAGIAGFGGGFAGVDVFFVLSGYLMTAIIWQRLEQDRFSLAGFYLDRARRIVPALLAVCAALLVFGWFWLPPMDYARLGEHAAGSASFVSNFIYKGEEGYFDAPSRDKWLLHTWSLSLEWQFYLAYPCLLMALRRFGRRGAVIVLAVVAAASFLASVLLTPEKSSFSFYLLPTRAWEMAAGGLVYFWRTPLRYAAAFEAAGFFMILASFFAFSADVAWPGHAAALPVLGTVFVLLAARQKSFFTSLPPLQKIGDWSYSIYLWHWPLVVARAYFLLPASWVSLTALVALSVLLGHLSYRFIEQPLRRKELWSDRKKSAILALTAVAVLAGLGLMLAALGGVRSRVPEHVARIDIAAVTPEDQKSAQAGCGFHKRTGTLTPCVDKGNTGTVFLWGDSHAGMIKSLLQEVTGATVISAIHSCATIFDAELKSKSARNKCAAFNDAAFDYLKTLPPRTPVIVANRFSLHVKGPNEGIVGRNFGMVYNNAAENARDPQAAFADHLTQSLCRIANAGHPVYVLAPVPEMGVSVPQSMARHFMVAGHVADVSIARADYERRHDVTMQALAQARKTCGVRILDPVPHLCDSEKCTGVSADGLPLYFDDDHLNGAGLEKLRPLLGVIRQR